MDPYRPPPGEIRYYASPKPWPMWPVTVIEFFVLVVGVITLLT